MLQHSSQFSGRRHGQRVCSCRVYCGWHSLPARDTDCARPFSPLVNLVRNNENSSSTPVSCSGAHRGNCGGSGRLKESTCHRDVSAADAVETTVLVQASSFRGNGSSRSTQRSFLHVEADCCRWMVITAARWPLRLASRHILKKSRLGYGHMFKNLMHHDWSLDERGFGRANLEASRLLLHLLVAYLLVELRVAFPWRRPPTRARHVAKIQWWACGLV